MQGTVSDRIPEGSNEDLEGGTGTPDSRFRDRLLGILGGAMVLGALILLLLGGERDTGARTFATPPITMVQPTSGALVTGPVHFVFDVPVEIGQHPGGWGTGDLHIHLEVNGREFMPSPRDIVRLPSGMYRWTLPGLPPGDHEVRLFWAGPDHRALAEGATSTISIRSR
jgi:hypothetical protein